MHFGTKFIKQYTSLINELLLLLNGHSPSKMADDLYHLAAVSGTLGLSTGHTLVQQQVTRWTIVQVLGSQGHAAPTHTVTEC